jgi:hypothetical protein
VQNFDTVFSAAMDSVVLSLETMRADFEHIFLVVIPEYGKWFYSNFTNILRDAAVAASHIVENIGKNISNALQGKPLIGLLEGFQATVDELPTIAERGATEVEKVLRNNIDLKMGKVVEDFEKNKNKNLDFLNKAMSDQVQTQMPEIDLKVNAKVGADKDDPFSGKSRSESPLQAFESRILTRGNSDSNAPMMRIANNTEQMVKEIRQINERSRASNYADPPAIMKVEMVK